MAWKLFKNVSRDQIIKYLEVDLKDSIHAEMGSLLRAGVGDFTIPLMFFSYVLELSEYLCGQRPPKKKSEEAELKFIRDYFDPCIYQEQEIKWFFHMYRHGLCHRFHPQNLLIDFKGKPSILKWLVFSDKDGCRFGCTHDFKMSDDSGNIVFEKRCTLKHFQITQVQSVGEIANLKEYAGCWLPISTNALMDDLVFALEKYTCALKDDLNLQDRFRDKIKSIHYSAKVDPRVSTQPEYVFY